MPLFSQIDWRDDHFELAGYTFRLQHQFTERTSSAAFLFYKHRAQIEQFERFFTESGFRPRSVLELGIWDGGSAAFWTETLDLTRYAAIDLQTRGDSEYFRQWLKERGRGRVKTHWGVSQTDGKLRAVVANLGGPLDLVLDDCSHQFAKTLDSFNLLFPLVRPGGWYVIEDWAWALQPEFQSKDHPWGVHPALHPLTHRIVELSGSRPDVVPSVRVFPEFIAVERGHANLTDTVPTSLVSVRARPWARIASVRAREAAGRLKRRIA